MSVFFGAHNIISPLGFTSRENFDALVNGKSALQKHTFPFSEKPFFCSHINESDLDIKFAELKNSKEYTFLEKLCILSVNDIIKQSGIDLQDKNNLLILSTTKGNVDILENKYPHISSQRVYLPEFAKTIGDFFNSKNTPLVVSNACISGLLAIIIAQRFIENKNYKNIIVCGADLVSEFTLSGFKSFNAMSEEACKPFDAKRTGINLGEAVASILLSENALSNIKIISGASANDANHISGPSRTGDGLFQAISETLTKAEKTSADLISAHGTATEYNDEMESVAFSRAKLNKIPLNSLKGYYGHTLGAAGVLESIISIMSLAENTLIKSLGFETPGTTQELNVISNTEKKEIKICLKTASGFGGCNAAAIFEKYKLENTIVSYCKISGNSVWLNGSLFHEESQNELGTFLSTLYKKIELNYPKFFKMDKLCKLGILATELLIRNTRTFETLSKKEMALVFANNASSLESDRSHANAISDKQNYFPSPSVFVYTLPNIVIGEIAIKHKITGENAFFVSEHFDAELMHTYTDILLQNSSDSSAICGWVNVDGNSAEAFVYCIKNTNFKQEKTPANSGDQNTHNSENIKHLYSLENGSTGNN